MRDEKFDIRKSLRIKLLIGLVTVILIVLMFPKGESLESEVTEGTIWIQSDLIAPFSFPIIKDPEVYKYELKQAAEGVYPVFIRNDEQTTISIDSIKNYSRFLISIIDSSIGLENRQGVINPTFLSANVFNTLINIRRQERNLTAGKNVNLNKIFATAQNVIADVYSAGVLSLPHDGIRKDSIAVRIGNVDKIEARSSFNDIEAAKFEIQSSISRLDYSHEIKRALLEYASHFVVPNITFSEALTAEEINQAQNNVSKYVGIINENERIIATHDRITRDAKLKIDSYKEAKAERIGTDGYVLQMVGKFLHIAFLLTLITIYIFLFRKKIFNDNQRILLLATTFLFLAFITLLVNKIATPAPMHYLIFIPAASMLLTIIFDSRIGFYSTVIMALIAGALRGNDYAFATMNLFAGALAVYSVRDIKNRSQIFRSFVFILAGYTVAVLAFGLERFAAWDTILVEFAFAGTNALISPVLTYGLLIFFERIFNITTDLTLLELTNFDRPLLKELARKTPGTFNHSMTMGTLAETAAERIGANPLLARVGAYYHDIGKILTPQNFVENQLNNQNIHENLTPEESVSLIVRHVNEGINIAREYKLPEEIIDFIPQHHGTMVISFFYDKAKNLYGEEKVKIENYTYPGPKPQSKETAIIMLADGCESAVRSIDNPDPVKVENLIDMIIKSRIEDGQLNESPLTFSDVDKIKEAFISILLGQHHRRIRYPKQDEMEQGKSGSKKSS
ncbi:MAG: HDIG domain-containing protein [Ignavibacteriaceae bacterium]|nr:HDIG domain-containing protein [Ignavibacteriaceae bacterium]